jgi:lipoate-protein ligase A
MRIAYKSLFNICLDEAILLEFANQHEIDLIVRVWTNSPAIVLGRGDDWRKEINLHYQRSLRFIQFPKFDPLTQGDKKSNFGKIVESIEKAPKLSDSVSIPIIINNNTILPIIRRASGGGTVLHGSGILIYSLFVSYEKYPFLFPVKDSYKIILNVIKSALKDTLEAGKDILANRINFFQKGLSDLAVLQNNEYLKFSGNSQFRKKKCLCHHGTLILNSEFLCEHINLLNIPDIIPPYRLNRKHQDFITEIGTVSVDLFLKNMLCNLEMVLLRKKNNENLKLAALLQKNSEDAKIKLSDFSLDQLKTERCKTSTDVIKKRNTKDTLKNEFKFDKLLQRTHELITSKYNLTSWHKICSVLEQNGL